MNYVWERDVYGSLDIYPCWPTPLRRGPHVVAHILVLDSGVRQEGADRLRQLQQLELTEQFLQLTQLLYRPRANTGNLLAVTYEVF